MKSLEQITRDNDAAVEARHSLRMVEVSRAADLAVAEASFAIRRYPPFNSPHEGYAVVLEELDEAWEAVRANDRCAAVREMKQVAAMALRFMAEFGGEP